MKYGILFEDCTKIRIILNDFDIFRDEDTSETCNNNG